MTFLVYRIGGTANFLFVRHLANAANTVRSHAAVATGLLNAWLLVRKQSVPECAAKTSVSNPRQRDNKGMGRTVAVFADMTTWTERLGHTKLRSFTDKDHHFWLEQNPAKNSKWAKLARAGHAMAWEFASPGGAYTGRLLIDGEIYATSEATKKFLTPNKAKK